MLVEQYLTQISQGITPGYENATSSFDGEQRVGQVCAAIFYRNTAVLTEAGHQPSIFCKENALATIYHTDLLTQNIS